MDDYPDPEPDHDRLVQCIVNLKIHTRPEFSLHEGTLVRECGLAYQILMEGLLSSVQDYNEQITFTDWMRHRLAEAIDNVIDDWSYLKTFANHRLTEEAFERVRQEFPRLFKRDEFPNNLLDKAEEKMAEANQWLAQFQNLVDSLDIVEELPPKEQVHDELDDLFDDEDVYFDEEQLADLHPLDAELLRRPQQNEVRPLLPSNYNPVTWLDRVRKFLYHTCGMLLRIHRYYRHCTLQEVGHSEKNRLHFEFMDLSEMFYCMGVYLVKFRKPLADTASALYVDHIRCFHRFRQVIETDPENEQLIRWTHCMMGIVERWYEMAKDMLSGLDILLIQCGRDFERTLTGNVHRVLFQLEFVINVEHQLDIQNCRANLSYRAQQILSQEQPIANTDDFDEVFILLEMMNECCRDTNTNVGYLLMIADRAEHSPFVKDIFEKALASSPLREDPFYANVTVDQIISAAQTVIDELGDQIQQLQELSNEYMLTHSTPGHSESSEDEFWLE